MEIALDRQVLPGRAATRRTAGQEDGSSYLQADSLVAHRVSVFVGSFGKISVRACRRYTHKVTSATFLGQAQDTNSTEAGTSNLLDAASGPWRSRIFIKAPNASSRLPLLHGAVSSNLDIARHSAWSAPEVNAPRLLVRRPRLAVLAMLPVAEHSVRFPHVNRGAAVGVQCVNPVAGYSQYSPFERRIPGPAA